MRIAVGGSAANPPHNGHRQLLEFMLSNPLFDKVIWIPSGDRVDKNITVSADHRVAMTELLIDNEWRLGTKTSPLVIKYDEIYGNAKTTYDRLVELSVEFPNDKLIWFTGSDSDISSWYNGVILVHDYSFYVIEREHYPLIKSEHTVTLLEGLPRITNAEPTIYLQKLKKPMKNINSTEIRNKLQKNNWSVKKYLPEKVFEYIRKNKLYTDKP